MRRDPSPPRFDARSPVQAGRSNAPYFLAAVVVAVAIWTAQQVAIDDSSPSQSHASAPNPVGRPSEASRSARGDLRTLFSADDYPAEAQRRGEEGTVRLRLAVNAEGRVSGCTLIQSSGYASLDNATCHILQRRARFVPAHGMDGNAIPDTVETPAVVWRLEG
jgi:protein TonB